MENTISWRHRFALEIFDSGGVILDLSTGAYFSLDRTAARACCAILSTETLDAAIATTGADLRIDRPAAAQTISDVMNVLRANHPRKIWEEAFRYHRDGRDYVLDDGAMTVIRVDDGGNSLRLTGRNRFGIGDYIRAITPKVLALQGMAVLHASAVSIDGTIVAFSGRSGAGKTTTARAFCNAGASMISEDLVILVLGEGSVGAAPLGEQIVREWQTEAEGQLTQDPSHSVSCIPLRSIVTTPPTPVRRICFVATDHRAGHELRSEPLDGPAAVGLLLENIFLGTDDVAGWRAHLGRARTVFDGTATSRLITPDGVATLFAAASDYSTISAS